MDEPKLSNIQVDHHRNGISGEPFHVCLFDEKEAGKMVAIIFDDPKYCAVLSIDLLAKGNIKFMENSWRGDNFEPQLREAIAQFERDWEKRFHG